MKKNIIGNNARFCIEYGIACIRHCDQFLKKLERNCVCLKDEKLIWLSVSGTVMRENVMLVKTGLTCEVPPCV